VTRIFNAKRFACNYRRWLSKVGGFNQRFLDSGAEIVEIVERARLDLKQIVKLPSKYLFRAWGI